MKAAQGVPASLLWGILFPLVFFSCRADRADAERNVFRYNESNGISSLDPAYARNLENMWAVNQVYDRLVELDSSLNIVPGLAHSWELSEDGTRYLFHLRNDVYFHDSEAFPEGKGRLFSADDAVYSLLRLADQATASPGAWILNPLGRAPKKAIKALNDSTLEIVLERPFPPFLGMLSTQYAAVVPREAIAFYGEDFRAHPVGTGPFKFAFWLEDVALVLHRNERYWQRDEQGRALPYLDAVKISFVKDKTAEYLGLLQGTYDFMSGLHPAYKDELLGPEGSLRSGFEDRIRLQRTPFIKTDYIGLLVDDSLDFAREHPIHDPRVRQALSMSIDRKSMARYLRNNMVYPAYGGFIPGGLPAHTDSHPNSRFDLEEAERRLAAAGYPKGQGMEALVLSTTSDYVDLCEFLQHQWGRIGIPVEVEVLPGPVHREKVARSQLLAFRKSWLADYADEENFLLLFYSENHSPGGPNYSHFRSSAFDSLYVLAMATADLTTRRAYYREMDRLVMDAMPVIPLYYDQVSHFVHTRVAELETNPVNMLDLRRARITEP